MEIFYLEKCMFHQLWHLEHTSRQCHTIPLQYWNVISLKLSNNNLSDNLIFKEVEAQWKINKMMSISLKVSFSKQPNNLFQVLFIWWKLFATVNVWKDYGDVWLKWYQSVRSMESFLGCTEFSIILLSCINIRRHIPQRR